MSYTGMAIASERKKIDTAPPHRVQTQNWHLILRSEPASNAYTSRVVTAISNHATKSRSSTIALKTHSGSNWTSDAQRQINEIKATQPSWHIAFLLADLVLEQLSHIDLKPDRIVPSSDDGISFYFLRGEGYALIECLTSGEIMALTKVGSSRKRNIWEVFPDVDSIKEAAEAIGRFRYQAPYEYPAASSRPT